MNRLIQIRISKNYPPIERNVELEQPLNELLSLGNLGAVLGGTSFLKRNAQGERILDGCSLDVILNCFEQGMVEVEKFLLSKNLKDFSSISFT